MKNVLVLIHDDDGQEARLQGALDATRATSGHLTCAHVTEFGPVFGDPYGMSGGVVLLELEREMESKNRANIEKRLVVEDVQTNWIEITGDLAGALQEVADLADLIVVNSEVPERLRPTHRTIVEPLVLHSRKPVLAVPDESGFRAADPVLIAWDGSGPSSAAMKSAVPLLALSESVTIYEVDYGSVVVPAEECASYLSRHGIHGEIVREKAPDSDFVQPLLLSRIESGRFAWAVMGAFSHSRIRETLFGGVTKRLLKESRVPLFIAH